MIDANEEAELLKDIARFARDPYGYVLYAFPWGEGELKDFKGPRAWQARILKKVSADLQAGILAPSDVVSAVLRYAVASGHGIGKSALVAWIIMWAMSTVEDTKGVVTANTEVQLKTKTWAELAKWHRLAINRHWFIYTATALYSADPAHQKTWRIDMVPWSAANTEAFAGLHNKGKRIILIFDEASAIDDVIWEVAEGALTDEDTEILWFAFGNPTRNSGRFRECYRHFRKRWHGEQIDSRTVEGTNKKQIAEWEEDYGENSDFFKVRVRGMFPDISAKQFMPIDLVDQALGRGLKLEQYHFAAKIITVDPAWEGDDELVIAFRQGLFFKILEVMPKNDNDLIVGIKVAKWEDQLQADAVFIDIGWGTGIVSYGRTINRSWITVGGADASNDPGCLNKRAEMWNLAKKWLREGGCIPNDQILYTDLISVEIVPRVDGKIQLEKKQDMKARGIPSPNRGDALALSFAHPVMPKNLPYDSPGNDGIDVEYNPLAS